ncbi:superoxide dismutase family protein [Streptosporangium saharense]|uniref:Superoxide dismutase [Cu-Zn] n=1 Tax=Streptosporangium saharense TaxID=1706840 RepID=A0A7W7VRT3_9ACTN|nr:superoxide dismutase family protein [Streptosporangium saharense]MBB4919889.1 Cu-Zn family superoxide dismutase [Streptosporangium saharense]
MFRKTHLALIVALGAGVVSIGAAATAESFSGGSGHQAYTAIKNAEGATIGTLKIDQERYGKSRVTVAVRGLTPGYHGFHIHTTGICDPKSTDPATGSPFFSAGGHFNLGTGGHGEHTGDLPALLVGADGTGNASVVTDRFRIGQLLDKDGSAVIVHGLPDNLANIPTRYTDANGKAGPDEATLKTGDAGGRIGCGVITGR